MSPLWEIGSEVLEAICFVLPAYVANSAPLIVAKLGPLQKFNAPVDFGLCFFGKRLFGATKTWRGLLAGVGAGSSVGLLKAMSPLLPSIEEAFVLSFGAMLGDLGGSFVKRRLGMGEGQLAPLLDQLDFLIGAFFLYWLSFGIFDAEKFLILLALTPLLHLVANIVAWSVGLKRSPW